MPFHGSNNGIKFVDDYDSMIFEAKRETTKRRELKILAPKQMLQRLAIALTHVQVGNTSENLLNEIRKINYSLYRAKEITKRVYNNIMNSIKV